MGVHDGHRARKRAQFLSHGLAPFADHEALELLLFYAIPRRDTNPIAHALLNRFGSLEAVFAAPVEELARVDGVGESAAVLLKLVPQLCQRARVSAAARPAIFHTTADAGAFFLERFAQERDEILYLAALDAKGKVLACRKVAEGSAGGAEISVRRIVEIALQCGAVSVVLAHNHPSGLALPSREDLAATRRVYDALKTMGIQLVDHIIAADGDFVSLAANGNIPDR